MTRVRLRGLALFTTDLLESSVELSEVFAFAAGEAGSIAAKVTFNELGIADLEGLVPMIPLAPLGAVRLLGLMRRTPRYVQPTAEVLGSVGGALLVATESPEDFRVRSLLEIEVVVIDAAMGVRPPAEAEVKQAVPRVEDNAEGKADKQTRLVLRQRRKDGMLQGSFKMPMRSANPLITAGALFATIEKIARSQPLPSVAQPMGAALVMVAHMSAKLTAHQGFDAATEMKANRLIREMLMADPVDIALSLDAD